MNLPSLNCLRRAAMAGASIFCVALCAVLFAGCRKAEPHILTILHTNDTHSQIDPDEKGRGGVLRRMAVIDSVRRADRNVMLIDAGDVVQGTLYFYLYGGQAEQELLNAMGLDLGVLGNHEFDNGLDSLATILGHRSSQMISTNYMLDSTRLAGRLDKYAIREFDGKRIAFIGINLDPEGMISPANYEGLEFEPIIETANQWAEQLKNDEGADAVIAITHIGYNPAGLTGDSILATNSRNIDIIIGGHSHDVIDPVTATGARRSRLTNLDGKEVLVVQTGKAGRNIGKISINLDSLGLGASHGYELLPVDARYDGYRNEEIESICNRYFAGVDSLMNLWVGTTEEPIAQESPLLLNIFTDFVMQRGKEIAPKVDLAIANKGGLRTSLPEGRFSKGHILNMLPFRNYITVVELKGSDLKEIFAVMAKTEGNGVSDNVAATYYAGGDSYAPGDVTIDGKPIDDNKSYRVATINYLAEGGDYMTAFRRGTVTATSPNWVYDDFLDYILALDGPLTGDAAARWQRVEAPNN